MDKINIVDWFDPDNIEHLKAFRELSLTGMWPKGFVPNNVEYSPNITIVVWSKLASKYLDLQLGAPCGKDKS